EYLEPEDLARIRPRHRRRDAHVHVRHEEAREDERVADEEDPHHRLAPRHVEGLLVGRPVRDDAAPAFGSFPTDRGHPVLRHRSHLPARRPSAERAHVDNSNQKSPSQTSSRKCQYVVQSSTLIASRLVTTALLVSAPSIRSAARASTISPPTRCRPCTAVNRMKNEYAGLSTV